MIAIAAPPSATQVPAKTPRANRLDTPPASSRCDNHPAPTTTITLTPAGSAPNSPIELWVRPSPLMKNGPSHDRARDNPHCAPKAAHQQAMIVGLSNRLRYVILTGLRARSAGADAVIGPSRPSASQSAVHKRPATPRTPKAQCQE